ncbi:hypothetical protein Ae201684_013244 [Aphanomyces euteiches]|uniref:Uncharacterized protein n=1 Tax=Aphanomyces euteiches TaxID=100861 RepID=A0A6G0WNN7_9STRA|nr:hypothetical protein Ae201684_013244 [Aphanomyces euteiches]
MDQAHERSCPRTSSWSHASLPLNFRTHRFSFLDCPRPSPYRTSLETYVIRGVLFVARSPSGEIDASPAVQVHLTTIYFSRQDTF